jgi:UDP-glucose 4-epimerase
LLEPVAVTGATGFIGGHLIHALVAAGCRPLLVTRSRKELFGEQARYAQLDLTDGESVGQWIEKEKPATLFHLAGTKGRDKTTACAEVNYHATARLLEEATRAGVKRVVIVGSAEEYGNQSGPLNENLPLQAATSYGASKAMATNHALMLHERDRFPVVVARPFSVYGPGQPSFMFIAEAIDAALGGLPFRMSGGEQKRDLVFVEDVVRGLLSAASAPGIEGNVINLGSGRAHRLRDVAELIWQLIETRAPLLIGARPAANEELYDTWADTTVARRLLDWEAVVGLEEGLRRTIEFARENLTNKVQRCQAM